MLTALKTGRQHTVGSFLDGWLCPKSGWPVLCSRLILPEFYLDTASSSFEGPSFSGSLSSTIDVCVLSEMVEGISCNHMHVPTPFMNYL